MGGTISVESEPGLGSTFHFTAWLDVEEAGAEEASGRWHSMTDLPVLIVDDNATNRRILEEVFSNWRMRPVAVEGGRAALAALEKSSREAQSFAVVLLDGHMPDLDGFELAQRITRDQRYRRTRVVMLTSAGEPEDVARCGKLGISAYLTKPVKQSELFDVVVSVLSDPVVEKPKSPKKTRAKRGLRVLLAEDNQVNQLVASRILEKLGHQVTVVSSGRQAVSAAQAGKFDVIVMDVQMPEMDGLEATAEIRRWERTTGKHVPIIAMTAHAMKGDRERCLEAGMDGYTSKPIRIKELEQAISKLVPTVSVDVPVSKSDEAEPVIDHRAVLEGFGGNRRLLSQSIRLFLADYPQRLAEIREAIGRGDANALARAAHALKGSVGNFALKDVFAIAQRLETMGRKGELATAGQQCIALESELALVSTQLRRLTRNSQRKSSRNVSESRQ